jgi:hypothetical protein
MRFRGILHLAQNLQSVEASPVPIDKMEKQVKVTAIGG